MIFAINYFLYKVGTVTKLAVAGVFLKHHTKANQFQISALYSILPIINIVARPLLCSIPDRRSNHKQCLMIFLSIVTLSSLLTLVLTFALDAGSIKLDDNSQVYIFMSLALFEIFFEVGNGASMPTSDSLTINYASRTNTEFTTYRVYGSISRMLCSILVGQVNEVSYVPKYTPALMIVIATLLIDVFLIWLWPDEYFVMTATEYRELNHEYQGSSVVNSKRQLMSWRQVVHHMLNKFLGALGCKFFVSKLTLVKKEIELESKEDNISSTTETERRVICTQKRKLINKKTQILYLAKLFRKDWRLSLYLMVATVAGFMLSLFSYMILYIEEHCNTSLKCSVSNLVGLILSISAMAEISIYIVYPTLKKHFSRVSIIAFGMMTMSIRFFYYGLLFDRLPPYLTVLIECGQSIGFGIMTITMAETASDFALAMTYVIRPKSVQGDNVPVQVSTTLGENDDNKSQSKSQQLTVLACTMQAIFGIAIEGLGKVLGAAVGGKLITKYSFKGLWIFSGCLGSLTAVVMTVGKYLADKNWFRVKSIVLD